MTYFKSKYDHTFYSKKGELVYCVIKNELLTRKELKKILCPYDFNISVVTKKYFEKVYICSWDTHVSFGVRTECVADQD